MSARAAAAACALLVASASPAPASPAPAVVVLAERTVPGFEAYEDALVVVVGTVRVAGSLRVQESRIVMLGGSRLLVEGATNLQASTIEAGPSSIEVAAGGLLALGDVDARGLTISSSGEVVLHETTVSSSPGDAITVLGGELEATDLTVTEPRGRGIRAEGAAVRLDGAEVTGALGYGIHVVGGSIVAHDVSIASAADYGLRADGARIEISGGLFEGHCGLFVGPGSSGRVENTSFGTSDHGITMFDAAEVALRTLSFDGGSVALAAYGTTLDVVGLTVTGVEQGIVAFDAGGAVTRAILEGSIGVEVDGDGSAVPMVREMDLSATVIGVKNRTLETVDARWNFWGGEPHASGAARSDGAVLVAPWLAAAPA